MRCRWVYLGVGQRSTSLRAYDLFVSYKYARTHVYHVLLQRPRRFRVQLKTSFDDICITNTAQYEWRRVFGTKAATQVTRGLSTPWYVQYHFTHSNGMERGTDGLSRSTAALLSHRYRAWEAIKWRTVPCSLRAPAVIKSTRPTPANVVNVNWTARNVIIGFRWWPFEMTPNRVKSGPRAYPPPPTTTPRDYGGRARKRRSVGKHSSNVPEPVAYPKNKHTKYGIRTDVSGSPRETVGFPNTTN
jgi:hypothetical protein